jgi:CheY-like chemotaxis protein
LSAVTKAISNGVIVAENDALMRGVLRSVLQRAGQVVFPVADGVEAVTLARQFRARLVLLDIGMPRLNGLLACEQIHALPGYEDVAIVMLTGYTDGRMRLAAQRLGASAFITKPFRPIMLLAQLASYIDVPAEALQPVGADAAPFGGSAQVWRRPKEPERGDSHRLVTGLDVVRICRDAQAPKESAKPGATAAGTAQAAAGPGSAARPARPDPSSLVR